MDIAVSVAIVVFVVDVGLHIAAIVRRAGMLRGITKVLLMPLLALVFYLAWEDKASMPWWVMVALLLGWAGDVFLLNHHPVGFVLGLVAFAAGHVCYLLQLLPLVQSPAWWVMMLLAAVYITGVAVTLKKLLPFVPAKYKGLCIFYTLLLSGLSAVAGAGVLGRFSAGAAVVFAGTLLFLTSDTILSFEIFKTETRWGNLKLMCTYIAAQVCLATGFYIWLT